nr:AAA family ATPase [Pseudomonas sp. LG1E9]
MERTETNSTIKLMPKYLKNYITEFNYLFNQIHKCTQPIAGDNNHEAFYNFGNNLRKFLEAYLFYKYPSHSSTEDKLLRFFGNDQLATDLSNRLYNEQSHLEEIFDRSIKPSEIPEIPKLASYVLNTIKEKDPDQYNSLIESIA